MTTQNDWLDLTEKIDIDGIEEQGDDFSVVPGSGDKQEIGPSSERIEFRPLTKKEKKEFVNSLDAKGKQILAELEGWAQPLHQPAA